jgi:hypothetical protein
MYADEYTLEVPGSNPPVLLNRTCLLPRSVSQPDTADLELDTAESSTDGTAVRDEIDIRLSLSTT